MRRVVIRSVALLMLASLVVASAHADPEQDLKDAGHSAADGAREGAQKVKQAVDEGKQAVKDAVHKGAEKVEEGAKKVEDKTRGN